MTDVQPAPEVPQAAVEPTDEAAPAEVAAAPVLAEGGTEAHHADVPEGTAVTTAGPPLPGEVNPPAVGPEVAAEPDEVPNFEPGPWSYSS